MANEKKLTAKDYKAIVEKSDGLTFHQKQIALAKTDPTNERHQQAREAGIKDSDDFMSKVRDHTAPGHEDALSRYKIDFNMDENLVRLFSIDRRAKILNTAPYELQNAAYENKVLSNYSVATADDQAFLAKFTELIKSKWGAVGYKGDPEVIADFFDKHPMSRPPRAHQRIG
jgi:hypothetical protein